uniref:Uncharacterized protein n=1 Tax=Chromera velia CCMP2878 TaxID=1169474 RepID=A0A0G4IG27_9ALVE|eukprot:Cvel_14162.t1-p1 / transcript=Cvel_14162.t1 / gene=Cvel_14162 / organism=Chromera_velia_CCMP2878 / gene_product=Probable glucuronokinase 2, putative / transcript_product=Probable glucuronokinase 2, putative / location=Cvel_scaffold998:8050-19278(-) / protein_length=959 / sequence_SO=supercontig / SO=protein_coding / is_pseudo=false
MICVLLCTSWSGLEAQLRQHQLLGLLKGDPPQGAAGGPQSSSSSSSSSSFQFSHLQGFLQSSLGGPSAAGGGTVPRGLLPVAGKSFLDHWWDCISRVREISEVFVVTNGLNYKPIERWAISRGIPVRNVVNNGASGTNPQRGGGSARDLTLAINRASASGKGDMDILAIAADSLFMHEFDIEPVLQFSSRKDGSVLLYFRQQQQQGEGQGQPTHATTTATTPPPANVQPPSPAYPVPPSLARVAVDPTSSVVTCVESCLPPAPPLFGSLSAGAGSKTLLSASSAQPPVAGGRGSLGPESSAGVPGETGGAAGPFASLPPPLQRSSFSLPAELLVPPLFVLQGSLIPKLRLFVAERSGAPLPTTLEEFFEQAVRRDPVFAMRLPAPAAVLGPDASLEDYSKLAKAARPHVQSRRAMPAPPSTPGPEEILRCRAFARVGLVGNPSDGYFGRTIACTISNFWAEAELWASKRVQLLPHPLFDPSSFEGLGDLHTVGKREGYHGGMRVMMATCKKFYEYCTERGIVLPKRNFTARYDTNIPRQVGLSGSSAIITALFRCLMRFHGLTTSDIPQEIQPSVILSVETDELGIAAGLQDRVAQVYEGVVFMDFDRDLLEKRGYGVYERLPIEQLQRLTLFLAYQSEGSDSGRVHSSVRARWESGDESVLSAMRGLADSAVEARRALSEGDEEGLMGIFESNQRTRVDLFGPEVIGERNQRMVDIAREHGCAAKFSGSGGAVVGVCPWSSLSDRERENALREIQNAYEAEDFVFCVLHPQAPLGPDGPPIESLLHHAASPRWSRQGSRNLSVPNSPLGQPAQAAAAAAPSASSIGYLGGVHGVSELSASAALAGAQAALMNPPVGLGLRGQPGKLRSSSVSSSGRASPQSAHVPPGSADREREGGGAGTSVQSRLGRGSVSVVREDSGRGEGWISSEEAGPPSQQTQQAVLRREPSGDIPGWEVHKV